MGKKMPAGVALALAVALGVTGCGQKSTSRSPPDGNKAGGQAGTDVARASGSAAYDSSSAETAAVTNAPKSTGDPIAKSKDAAAKSTQESLDTLKRKWQELEAKAAPATAEAEAEFRKATDMMVHALSDSKAKATGANASGVDVWNSKVKPSLDAALSKAQKLYDDAAAKFGGK